MLLLKKSNNIARANQIHNYLITDFTNNMDDCEHVIGKALYRFNDEATTLLPFHERVKRFLDFINFWQWVLLILMTSISTTFIILMDYACHWVQIGNLSQNPCLFLRLVV